MGATARSSPAIRLSRIAGTPAWLGAGSQIGSCIYVELDRLQSRPRVRLCVWGRQGCGPVARAAVGTQVGGADGLNPIEQEGLEPCPQASHYLSSSSVRIN